MCICIYCCFLVIFVCSLSLKLVSCILCDIIFDTWPFCLSCFRFQTCQPRCHHNQFYHECRSASNVLCQCYFPFILLICQYWIDKHVFIKLKVYWIPFDSLGLAYFYPPNSINLNRAKVWAKAAWSKIGLERIDVKLLTQCADRRM